MAEITIDIVFDNPIGVSMPASTIFDFVGVEIDNYEKSTPVPFWDAGTIANSDVDRGGVISGTVKVLGVLQNKARVLLYFRKTGQLIQATFTDASGVFSFDCGLNRNVSDYYAVAITEQPYNAQVFDKLTPA